MTLAQHMTGTDLWYTPERYLDAARIVLGGIDLDPASSPSANATVKAERIWTATDDGLVKPWQGAVWCNPPYSQTAAWVKRWADAFETGEIEAGILLVNANTDTRWFRRLWRFWLCFTDHRIRFVRPDGTRGNSPTKGQVFAYGGTNSELFAQEFSEFGHVVCPCYAR